MKKILSIILGTLLLLVGCDTRSTNQMYKGNDLTVGVIGPFPNISEENVVFEKITLDDLKESTEKISNDFDAVIITKEFLSEADDEQYVTVYNELEIPTFFMQSTKAHVPFVNKGVDYDTFIDIQPLSYATGYLNTSTDNEIKYETWRYELKDHKENDTNIQELYSRIFQTIDSLK
ncbi:hypothetical protein [Lysinibacillus cavernae]|uniref:hypothetical protein n=1 Tax=Lysinibacillus cavernae TaxID=2666135 RepID=UPI0012D8B79F|nr:hypothetical protein [Lysinibacillus cavernae]